MQQHPQQPPAIQIAYDNKNQLDRVKQYIIPRETLYAVFDCKGGGTGFVGITDQRIIFYDQGQVTKRKQMVSIPFHQITAVSSIDEGTIFKTSEVMIMTAAGNWSFEFRGADKAHWTYSFIMNQILNRANPQMRG